MIPGHSERPKPHFNPFSPGQASRPAIAEVDVEDMGNMLRQAFVGTNAKFTIYCDKSPTIGGVASLPRR